MRKADKRLRELEAEAAKKKQQLAQVAAAANRYMHKPGPSAYYVGSGSYSEFTLPPLEPRKPEHRLEGAEIVGFRQWWITEDMRLKSGAVDFLWNRDNEATCLNAGHKAPSAGCECGLYALHEPSSFWYNKRQYQERPAPGILVSGVITAHGLIEVHAEGFRAQYAKIVALAKGSTRLSAYVISEVAKDYGVSLVDSQELVQIAGEYGQPIPEAMRPVRQSGYDPVAQTLNGRSLYALVQQNPALYQSNNLYWNAASTLNSALLPYQP